MATAKAADDEILIEAPQVFNARGDLLGHYGGLMPVTRSNGETVNAIAVIMRTGYILPMTPQGDVGQFRSAYFADDKCAGDEYLSPVADRWGSAPLSGLIYRSLGSAQVRYLAQFRAAVPTNVKSRMHFDNQNILRCEALDINIDVLQSAENDPAVTGYSHAQMEQSTIALRIPETTSRQSRSVTRRLADGAGQGTVSRESLPVQQECSPGCLVEDMGNDVCEISCYVEACYFDGGDCSNETADFLEEELARMCSPGCFLDDLGDSFCDEACNNSACGFDDGDCNR